MKEQPSNPCEKVSFILTYDQLEAAYNIYREQFISCDFIRRSMERLRKESDSATFHMKRCVMIQAFFMKHTCSFSDWKTAMWLITTRWSR